VTDPEVRPAEEEAPIRSTRGRPDADPLDIREAALFPEMNPGPVCRLDLDAVILRANRAAVSTFGDHLIGGRWMDFLPGLTPAEWDRIVEGGERVWLETDVDGTCLGFTMARAPGTPHVYVYGVDITALKEAERRLGEIARFPEMNPGPVLRLDRDGVILLANHAARELFGQTDLRGRRWQELCPGLTPELWAQVRRAASPLDHETRLAGRHVLFTHTPDPGSDQVFVYGADLTELKAAERAVRQSERMATLGTLAAGVAHELNNPSAAVQRAAEHLQTTFGRLQEAQLGLIPLHLDPELLERLGTLDRTARERASSPPEFDPLTRSDREYDVEIWLEDRDIEEGWDMAPALVSLGYGPHDLDELADTLTGDRLAPVIRWMARTYPVHAVLEEIRHGASRISEIVSALKAYSYVGQAPVQSVDVNEGIRHTLIILQNKLKGGITVDLDLDPELPGIQAYGGELNQVWTNLIDNAADAMDGRGRLTIRTTTHGDGVRVEVEDDGPGIPESIQARVFDPFFTTKEPGKGTGLGLNTTYNTVVKKHGGTIELRSKPGRTVFVIGLPRHLDDASAAPAANEDLDHEPPDEAR
jgi:signal transduction histidine kinase